MKRFEGKTALVTGAGGGIGGATAQRLAAEGAAVWCTDVDEKGLENTVKIISDAGGTARADRCDVSDAADAKRCVTDCVKQHGGLDVLCHLAGILLFDHAAEMPLERWQKIIGVNLTGTFLMCQAALPHLEKSKGCIVNAASSSSLSGLAYGTAYSASKGGVLAYTRSIAIEYVKRGVRANCVCPAGIRTEMTKQPLPEGADATLLGRHESMAGWGDPADVATVIATLASEDAARVNGEDVRVDGGALS